MTNTGVAIRYGDVAPGAKENFFANATESQYNSLSQLQINNINFPNYANPCELYSVVLDGRASVLPSNPEVAAVGLWSVQLSQGNGQFGTPIVLTLESDGQYSSQGLTFTFDTDNNIHPTRMNIQWIRTTSAGIETLATKEFYPDSAFYYCQNQVVNYNKLVITFYSLNMPHNRLKMRTIDYGYGTFFEGDELRSVQISQSIDPVSSEIKINTCDFTLDSKCNIEYSFQDKQPLSIYFNGKLRATSFVSSATRKSKTLWSVKSEDYIGLMNDVTFYGDVYENKNAYELLTEIFDAAKVPYDINSELNNVYVSGYIPITNCRTALMHVAFATQNIVDTSESDVVRVCRLMSSVSDVIPSRRILQGQNFSESATVTGVELTVHTYEPTQAYADNGEIIRENAVVAYNAIEDGVGNNVLVKFDEPLHSLYSLNEGEILHSTANYAIVNATSSNFRVIGFKYNHTTQTKRKTRADINVATAENVKKITSSTLVTVTNADNVLNSCFDWLTKTNSVCMSIVEGKNVEYGDTIKWGQRKWGSFKWGEKAPDVVTYDSTINVGDHIQSETEYMGLVDGVITSQSYALNGNILVKKVGLK